jgi:ferredoxin
VSARIRFHPLGIEGHALENETVLDVARRVAAPIGNSCGGTGICGRCRVTILEGAENLSNPTWIEQNGEEFAPLGPQERLACQAAPSGPVSVTTGYWGVGRG